MIWTLATFTLGLLTYLVDRYLRKHSPETDKFPLCVSDKDLMTKIPVGSRSMPPEIRQYLDTWNLSDIVIKRYVCQRCGRELWIAPQVGDMEKSLFVGRSA